MDVKHKLVALLAVQHFDEYVGIGSWMEKPDTDEYWMRELLDILDGIVEEYAETRYEEDGYALIATPSIRKTFDYKKIIEFMNDILFDYCVDVILFDDANKTDVDWFKSWKNLNIKV
jgi:hypothetical protein